MYLWFNSIKSFLKVSPVFTESNKWWTLNFHSLLFDGLKITKDSNALKSGFSSHSSNKDLKSQWYIQVFLQNKAYCKFFNNHQKVHSKSVISSILLSRGTHNVIRKPIWQLNSLLHSASLNLDLLLLLHLKQYKFFRSNFFVKGADL